MSDQDARVHQQDVELLILDLLYERRKSGIAVFPDSAPSAFRELYRRSYPAAQASDETLWAEFRTRLGDLREGGLVAVEGKTGDEVRLRITTNGIRRYGRLRPSLSYAELDGARTIILDEVADLIDLVDELENKQKESTERLRTVDERFAAHRDQVEQSIRNLYGQTLVLLGVFVAAFALIIAGAQVATRSESATFDQTFLQSLAVMGGVTLPVLALVVVAWYLSGRR